MSTLKADTIQSTSGGAATLTKQSAAKSWWQVDGTSTAHINDSFNTSGFTDHGTGDYQVNFTNNMGNVNYANTSNSNNAHALNGNAKSADNLRVGTYNSSTSLIDSSRVMSDANGDLA